MNLFAALVREQSEADHRRLARPDRRFVIEVVNVIDRGWRSLAGANLVTTLEGPPEVVAGEPFELAVAVTNLGPDAASDVTVAATLSDFDLLDDTVSQGAITTYYRQEWGPFGPYWVHWMEWTIGEVAVGETITATVQLRSADTGLVNFGAHASGSPRNATAYPGSATYNATSRAKMTPTITWTAAPPVSVSFGGGFPVAATASSGLPVSISTEGPGSYDPDSGVVTTTGAGTVVVTATQGGDANWLAAPELSATVTVAYRFVGFSSPVDRCSTSSTPDGPCRSSGGCSTPVATPSLT